MSRDSWRGQQIGGARSVGLQADGVADVGRSAAWTPPLLRRGL